MKRILCCLGKTSASNVVQETGQSSQQRQPTDSSVRVDDENEEDLPFGNNEFLNNAWRNNLELPDDREFPDSGAAVFPSSPPIPADSGPSFLWHQIVDGTQNFRREHFLGRGNFGEVYRCDFPSINKVGAVKIQNHTNPTGHLEFIAELTTLHAANHPNVIKLIGKCYGERNRAIIYEFMPKGSLDQYLLASPGHRQILDWGTRMKIAFGVSQGLKYVHNELKMIHGDFKAENILLDENFVPKLTDFGLVKKVVQNEYGVEQQTVINPIKGTPGYIAPETEASGLITTKSDVYSFGVFLLVLVTGSKAYDNQRPPATRKITDWIMPLLERNNTSLLAIDTALGNKYSLKALDRLIFAVNMCLDADVSKRPDMYCVEMIVRQAEAFSIDEDQVKERRSV